MPDNSFDVVSKIDLAEVSNAVQQAMKEIIQRYDLKDSKSNIELNEKDKKLWVYNGDQLPRWAAEHRDQLQRWSEDQATRDSVLHDLAARLEAEVRRAFSLPRLIEYRETDLAGNPRHETTELVTTAGQIARDLEGDCRQHAMLAAAMCRAAGVR